MPSIKVIVKNLFDVHESVYAGDKLRQYRELKKEHHKLTEKLAWIKQKLVAEESPY